MAEGERSQTSLPKQIGRYQITASLGAGAMGAVYKGFDPLIKRTLAIKTIRLDIHRASDEYKMFLERFYQEARISGTLSHPNIVTLFDIGEDNGVPFLALEFIEGETIESILARGVKFRPEKVISLISQIAAALDYAHSKGVIHRDVKPANLLLYEDDRIKVTDFGIAKLADTEMTKAGQLLGTPSYMSPEQAMGEKLDGRSDIFSLGVCAFEMLCGKQPFPGNNVTAILYRLVHMEPIEPDNLEMNGLIPQKWHEVFPKVLSKKRDERYQTSADFVRDLEYCLGSWFTGLGEDLAPTASVPAPSIPAVAAAPPVAPPPATAPPAAVAPSGLAARKSDDPSIVVSMDEIQDYVAPAARRPAAPAVPDDEDLPQTVAMKPGEKEGSLPPTVSVARPAAPDEDELPETVAVPRPPIPQEKTIVLPPPTAAAPVPPQPAPIPPQPARATPPSVTKPASNPPFRPMSATPFKPGSLPPYKPPTPFGSQPPRLPGPGSRAPVPKSVESREPLETEPVERPRAGLPMGWVVGGAAALLAVALAVGALRMRASGGASAGAGRPDGQSAGAGKGAIRVETTPSGATITLNDQEKGKSPASLSGLAPGTYEVVAELSEHEPAFQKLTLQEGDAPVQVKLELPPSKNATSEADILSRPPGAAVLMDGQKIGQTPLRGIKLRVGNRRFHLTTEGYEPFVEFLKVEEGKTARLDAHMVALGSSPPPETATPAPAKPTSGAAAAAPKPTPTPVPTTTLAATAPTTMTPAAAATTAPAPSRPTVDTTRIYIEGEVDTKPRKLSGASYSPVLKPGEELFVTLSWVVNENGDVADVEVVESGGKALDEAVIQALRKSKYAPGVKQGVKVKVRMAVKFRFRAG